MSRNIKEKAKLFAIKAHKGQVRKAEPDKPYIMHPIGVANLLEQYGYDDMIVAAGYLHDVVEDTEYTISDIEREFGRTVACLVMGATEKDKTLPWIERKKQTIEKIKTLSFENKLVICADKINNLEDLIFKFGKSGERDFSAFNGNEEQKKWYYMGVFESLIYNEDSSLPIFRRLKKDLEIVFDQKEDFFLEDTFFKVDPSYFRSLKKLYTQKEEICRLKEFCPLPYPFLIDTRNLLLNEKCIVDWLFKFFEDSFKISFLESSAFYKEELRNLNHEILLLDFVMDDSFKEKNFYKWGGTKSFNTMDTFIEMTSNIMMNMRENYIQFFNQKYGY